MVASISSIENVGIPASPANHGFLDPEGRRDRRVVGFALTRVDLDLDPDRRSFAFRLNAEAELWGHIDLVEARPAEPWDENLTDLIEHRPNGPAGGADKVDVLRVALRLREVQLVERGAAPKSQLATQERVAEQLHEHA